MILPSMVLPPTEAVLCPCSAGLGAESWRAESWGKEGQTLSNEASHAKTERNAVSPRHEFRRCFGAPVFICVNLCPSVVSIPRPPHLTVGCDLNREWASM